MADPTRPHALTGLTAGELAQAWRDQETSLAVIRQDPADDPAPLDDLPLAGDQRHRRAGPDHPGPPPATSTAAWTELAAPGRRARWHTNPAIGLLAGRSSGRRRSGQLAPAAGRPDSAIAFIFSSVVIMPFRLVRIRARPAMAQYSRVARMAGSSKDSITSVPSSLGSS